MPLQRSHSLQCRPFLYRRRSWAGNPGPHHHPFHGWTIPGLAASLWDSATASTSSTTRPTAQTPLPPTTTTPSTLVGHSTASVFLSETTSSLLCRNQSSSSSGGGGGTERCSYGYASVIALTTWPGEYLRCFYPRLPVAPVPIVPPTTRRQPLGYFRPTTMRRLLPTFQFQINHEFSAQTAPTLS